MNNPWPTRSQRRCEALASRLLAEQLESEMAFRAAVGTALTTIKRLEFPLGCPASGYDMQDVTGALNDWLMPQEQQALSDRAYHAAGEILDQAA